MVYRSFSIGMNENNDLCLTKYDQKCEYISNNHACIFFDEYSRQYELLNYSENGTVVDNILFSNDTSIKVDDEKDDDESSNSSNSFGGSSCDSIINSKMSSKKGKNYWSCKCKSSLTDLFNGKCWEGSAILNHGSHIKFGCLEFIFCVINYDQDDDGSIIANKMDTSV
jgi:hypothetical protein